MEIVATEGPTLIGFVRYFLYHVSIVAAFCAFVAVVGAALWLMFPGREKR